MSAMPAGAKQDNHPQRMQYSSKLRQSVEDNITHSGQDSEQVLRLAGCECTI